VDRDGGSVVGDFSPDLGHDLLQSSKIKRRKGDLVKAQREKTLSQETYRKLQSCKGFALVILEDETHKSDGQ